MAETRNARSIAQAPSSPRPLASIRTRSPAEVGRLVRLARAKRGMTRRQLAQGSGASERYLAQIESGQGNPSVDHPQGDRGCARRADHRAFAAHQRAHRRDDPHSRSARAHAGLRAAGRRRADRAPRWRRARRRSRRGGSRWSGCAAPANRRSGSRLAQHLDCPFIELDRMVEQEYGARIPDLIEMAGWRPSAATSAPASSASSTGMTAAVIATAGGIVSNAETYALLLRRTHTVWIKARPDEHMSRVMEQGDFRPMAQNREAMADLVAILDARSADYARAEAELDTSGDSVEQSFAKLQRTMRPAPVRMQSGADARDARRPGLSRSRRHAARIPHDRPASGRGADARAAARGARARSGCGAAFPSELAAATGAGVFAYSRAGYGRSSPCQLPRPVSLHARRGAPGAAARARRDRLPARPPGRPQRRRLDRGDLCRQHPGSPRARAGADGAALLHRGHGHRRDRARQGGLRARAICAASSRGCMPIVDNAFHSWCGSLARSRVPQAGTSPMRSPISACRS